MTAHHSHHHHDHHHDHAHPQIDHINTAFLVGIGLNLAFVLIEAITGFITGSLSLLTDAGHNLSDVAGLALALMAIKLAKVKATRQYTYGYKRSTIMVSLLNAIILFVGIAVIFYEAVNRLLHPLPLQGLTIAWVAFVGIGINGFTAWLFIRDKERKKDLNIRGAFMHMALDALVSLGVVISGVLMYYTHWFWIDSVVSFVIGVVILVGTWHLLIESLRLALDGVPAEMDIEKVKAEMLLVDGVVDVHHLHVWALSTSENALTAHLVINEANLADFKNIKHDLRHRLEHLQITHTTFEPELQTETCVPNCHLMA